MLNYNYFALYPVFLIHSYLLKFEQKHYNLINMKNKFCKFIFYAYFCDMSLTAKEARKLSENILSIIHTIALMPQTEIYFTPQHWVKQKLC